MITRYKPKNITRVVNHARCCKGYAPDDDNFCQAQCLERPCLHGACVEPDVCSCNPGFSGPTCNEVGCPGGNWGPDCSEECLCENGARCEPHTGQCLCPPGFTGERKSSYLLPFSIYLHFPHLSLMLIDGQKSF